MFDQAVSARESRAKSKTESYLRQFTPEVLAAIDFTGGPGTADLMSAVAILKKLNTFGARKVPADAPTSFAPARYGEYLDKARMAGDDTAFPSTPRNICPTRAYRRKIARQLNKGESLHALRRDLHYAQQGTIGKPLLADQTEHAWCLTVLTNSVITWVTEYYQLAVQDLRASGRAVPDELLPTSPRPIARTSASSASSLSTWRPSSIRSAGGRCAPPCRI